MRSHLQDGNSSKHHMAKPEPAAMCHRHQEENMDMQHPFHLKDAFYLGKLQDFVDGVDLTVKQLYP